jgi:Dipeptidyl aminopeptidases/acylaminoacyl-peptidases
LRVHFHIRPILTRKNALGVTGWSYGGISTNYIIATTTRFKSATSGASISNALAGYGTDQYVRDYENELGAPWNNSETWMRLSYPFLHADRIKTPTLFLCGQNDFNVPLLNTEQMYQALRSLGVPTELVIYPGEFHEFKKPATSSIATSAISIGTRNGLSVRKPSGQSCRRRGSIRDVCAARASSAR